MMLSAGVADAGLDDARGAYLEIIAQAASGVAQALSVRLERPVATLTAQQIELGQEELRDTTLLYAVDISLQETPPRRIYVGWTNALELASASAEGQQEGAEVDALRRRALQPEKSTTFDLLMEVELPVSVSFGRAQLPLRDVLKLNSGSIVELNRTISDPVEIIVNNCVIARGEVVVVDGNYGVRIQHVISREERLRTLK
jgi:flagellar motor switch protein FliN/FliY